MLKIIILGTANAVPDEDHENAHLALIGEQRRVLIDCTGSPVVRLKRAGIDLMSLTDLFLTHFHPDHVSGVPSLLMSMWLLGREKPLDIYGLSYTLDRFETMMSLYEWEAWPDFFPINLHRLPDTPMNMALDCDEFQIFTSPVSHLIPTIGLRIEATHTGRTLAYSCDTEPCDAVVELANTADFLIHEATGPHPGHSTASQAGSIAARAVVGSLYLIHYNPNDEFLESQARKEFSGSITRAQDFMTIEI